MDKSGKNVASPSSLDLTHLWIELAIHYPPEEQRKQLEDELYNRFIDENYLLEESLKTRDFKIQYELSGESEKRRLALNAIKKKRNYIIDNLTFKAGNKDFSHLIERMLLSLDPEKGYNAYVFEHSIDSILAKISAMKNEDKDLKQVIRNYLSLFNTIILKTPQYLPAISLKLRKHFTNKTYFAVMASLHKSFMNKVASDSDFAEKNIASIKFWVSFNLSHDKYFVAIDDALYLPESELKYFSRLFSSKLRRKNRAASQFFKRIEKEFEIEKNPKKRKLFFLILEKKPPVDYSDLPLFSSLKPSRHLEPSKKRRSRKKLNL